MENGVGLCSCKGRRSCKTCERAAGITPKNDADEFRKKQSFIFCPLCRRAYDGWIVDFKSQSDGCLHNDEQRLSTSIGISGILLIENFLTVHEEAEIIKKIESIPWMPSQSGRLKQDFGPKVNFKKRQVRPEAFKGFPDFITNVIIAKLRSLKELGDFDPVEMCNLRYNPKLGSSIDPHLDDAWLWGERLVTINLGAPTILTLISPTVELADDRLIIRVPMRPRSLIILSDEARFEWSHAVLREDVVDVRWAITFRELSTHFLPGGDFDEIGKELLERSKWTYNET